MKFELPKLKYPEDGLVPYISKQTVQYHYGTHTKKYYDTVNKLIKDTVFEKHETLDDLIINGLVNADTKLFNNACQAWNHTFYWDSIGPKNDTDVSSELNKAFTTSFGSFNKFKDNFTEVFVDGFGSMWTWLILEGKDLRIKNTPNAGCPLTKKGQIPLLVVDGWEHSYYLQYPADKAGYMKAIWNIINWEVLNDRFKQASA